MITVNPNVAGNPMAQHALMVFGMTMKVEFVVDIAVWVLVWGNVREVYAKI